ncbi:hypothetical protein GUJ93_ZPchr0008g12511 [Zizania palustris]|uniref:Exopolygalacturonase n=1 Tax=Zizania palustris TaxID=103762 RepID=A0A8J5VKN0_ZIZPA|nr:hypothetical protein GUJ93_ZPchr0008g12511 [Zizania palustris]
MAAIINMIILHWFILLHGGHAYTTNSLYDAFMAAWAAACGSGTDKATVLIPEGTFAVGAVKFSGPCKASVVVVVDGVLRPPCAGGCGLYGVDAWILFIGVSNLVVTGAGTFDAQGSYQNRAPKSFTTTLKLEGVGNSRVSGLRFMNSRGFHVNVDQSNYVVAEGLHIEAPANSPNTDGIHVGRSNHVWILDSAIGTGDDCVSLGPGSTDVVVRGVVCGPGHGISIGSLGKYQGEDDVRGLIIKNCTLSGTTNGLRIKTWPASPPSRAFNITFQDIVMANVYNPIIIDQHYCPHGQCAINKPSMVQISDVTYERIRGTSRSKMAVQLLCSEERPCSRVRLDSINLSCGQLGHCGTKFSNVQGLSPCCFPPPEQEDDVRRVQHRTNPNTPISLA